MRVFLKTLTASVALFLLATGIMSAQRPGGFPGGFPGGGFPGRGGNSNGYVTGSVKLNPDNEGDEVLPGEGAVIIVSFMRESRNLSERREHGESYQDSLFTVVGSNGNFNIRNVPVGSATVKVTLMGYNEMSRQVTINPGENKYDIFLDPEKLTLAQSVVTAKVPPLSIIQDTIVMNASAVKFNKGEMAIDILEQMPGVESGNGGITILGEQIQNVYVDGVLLFGNSPMTALNNLPAEEVIALKSFQEYANKDPRHRISETESKQRVLDISTKSKAKFVVNGNTTLGGGYDTDTTYHKFRYTVGAEAIATSEKLQFNASINANNINNGAIRMRGASFGPSRGGSSPDLRNLSASFDFTKKWMSKTVKNFVLGQINGGYSYSESYNVTESRSESIYFPKPGQYDSRVQTSRSKSITESGRHNFSLGLRKNIPDGNLGLNGSYSISDGLTTSNSRNENNQTRPGATEPTLGGTATGNRRETNGTSYSLSLNADKGFWNVLRVGVRASAGQSTNTGLNVKKDTLLSTGSRTVLNIDSNTPSRNLSISPNVRLDLGTRQSISLSYSYSETYNKTEELAYDVTDIANRKLDELNTRTMTNDNNTHSADLSYSSALWTDGPILRASISYRSVGLAKDEKYPINGQWDVKNHVYDHDEYDHRFNSWAPSISLGTEGLLNRWSIRYSQSSSTPSLEQVRPRLDNTNLVSVRAGNPNLKQGRSHDVSLSFSTPLGNFEESTFSQNISTISLSASFRVNQNRIASNTYYFPTEVNLNDAATLSNEAIGYGKGYAALPSLGYNYLMPAQSTFSTYVNVDDAYSASTSLRFDTEISPIRCNLNTGLSFSWDNTPELIDGVQSRTTNYNPNFSLGLRSNFSRNLRFNLSGNVRYSYSHNDLRTNNNSEYWTESLTAGAELNNILQAGYVSGNYTKSFMQGIQRQGINDNIFDVRSGLRFGPRNNFDISVVIHDIFNKTSGFSTSQTNDYITNRWSRNFGRYFLITLSYSFNSLGRKGGSGGNERGRGGFSFPGGMMPPMGGGMPAGMMRGLMMGGGRPF